MDIKLTFNLLPVASVLLALVFFYAPKKWIAKYNNLESAKKQWFMIGFIALGGIVAWGISMLGLAELYPTDLPIYQSGWLALVDIAIAVVANAGIYKAVNRTK